MHIELPHEVYERLLNGEEVYLGDPNNGNEYIIKKYEQKATQPIAANPR